MGIIETMVVIVIVAVLMMIGVPSLQSWFTPAQVSAKAESVLNGLQFARAEALRRNTRIFFSMSADTSWSVGCVVTNAACPSAITSKSSGEAGVLDASSFIPDAARTVTFNGIGAVATNADGSASLAQIEFSKSGGGVTKTLRILVTSGGQSRICDPAVTTVGDPKKC